MGEEFKGDLGGGNEDGDYGGGHNYGGGNGDYGHGHNGGRGGRGGNHRNNHHYNNNNKETHHYAATSENICRTMWGCFCETRKAVDASKLEYKRKFVKLQQQEDNLTKERDDIILFIDEKNDNLQEDEELRDVEKVGESDVEGVVPEEVQGKVQEAIQVNDGDIHENDNDTTNQSTIINSSSKNTQ